MTIKEEQESIQNRWENDMITFDFWLSLIDEVEQRIKRYRITSGVTSQIFAYQLFDGYLTLYLTYCLQRYTSEREHPNRRFSLAVQLLFNDEPLQLQSETK